MKSVVINASGGGADFGTKGNGLVEKNVSLEISKKIYDILKSRGVDTYLLRNGDTTISYDDRIKDLKSKYPNKDNVILISNTLNSGGSSGIEIIYPLSKKDTLPKLISSKLETLNDTKYYQYRYSVDTTKDYFYLTRETIIPITNYCIVLLNCSALKTSILSKVIQYSVNCVIASC